MAFRRFIRVADSGAVLEDRMSSTAPTGEQWREVVKKEDLEVLGYGTQRLFYDGDAGLRLKPMIRLSVGGLQFPADGETPVAIGIRGKDLPDDVTVRIHVNGEPHEVAKYDDLMLTSEQPGSYKVRAASDIYYVYPSEIEIDAVEPPDEAH